MKTQLKRHRHANGEQGIALLTVVFALMLVSAIAFGMMYMANTETRINANYRDLEKAQFGAWSGIHEARARIISSSTNYITPPTSLPTSTGGIIYILNQKSGETVDPNTGTYLDTELCHEGFNLSLTDTGANVPCTSGPPTGAFTTTNSVSPDRNTTSPMPYKWVRITMKSNISGNADTTSTNFSVNGSGGSSTTQVCFDGKRQRLLPSGATSCENYVPPTGTNDYLTTVYVMTALAVTNSDISGKGARRMVQMETAFNPPLVTNAAVASNDNVILNGALTVSGYDQCSCNCYCVSTSNGNQSSLNNSGACGNNETYTCSSRSGHSCDNTKYGIYAEGSIQNPTGANENVYAGTSPAYTGNHSDFPYDIPSLINSYKNLAGVINVTGSQYGYSCTSSDCGTQSGQTFGATSSAFPPNPADNPSNMPTQITYVPGNLHLTGGSTGSGILIVDGDLQINGGIQFYGLILVKGSITFTGGGSSTTNIYGSVLSGTPIIDQTTLGGSANIQFDRCALARNFTGQPPTVLSSRELPY